MRVIESSLCTFKWTLVADDSMLDIVATFILYARLIETTFGAASLLINDSFRSILAAKLNVATLALHQEDIVCGKSVREVIRLACGVLGVVSYGVRAHNVSL